MFKYKFNEDGSWLYKADTTIFKKNGSLKKKEHDLPAFKSVFGIEGAYKEFHDEVLIKSVKETVKKLTTFKT